MDSLWVNLEDKSDADNGISMITQAMEIENVGCVVKVHTSVRNADDSYTISESTAFVPWTKLGDRVEEEITVGKKLVPFQKF